MATQQSSNKKVMLSYGGLAVVLLATLLIGVLSGAVLGGFATAWLLGRPTAPGGVTGGPARAWVGITYIPVTAAVARSRNLTVTRGALILTVTPNSPADKAGLRADDIIIAIEGRTIDAATSVLDVIQGKKPGDRVKITILRGNREQTVEISLGRSPTAPPDRGQETPWQRLRRSIDRLLPRQ